MEDLLRLKRAERPAPEFWEQFDRELRAKQLAALVEKRSWWRDTPRLFTAGWTRYHLPIGAAAVLALAFLTLHDYSTAPEQGTGPLAAMPAGPVALIPSGNMVAANAGEISAEAGDPAALSGETESAETIVKADSAAKLEPSTPAGPSRVIPLLVGTLEASPATAETSPSARSIAANLAALEAVAPKVAGGLLGKARSFDTRLTVARTVAVEPLQQMTPPSEVRLARYRSPLVVMTAAEDGDRTGERIARRISGERLYEQIGRISARGDRMNVKF